MKRIAMPLLAVLVALISMGSSSRLSVDYVPVLMERSELEKSVFYRDKQEVKEPGKIYYKDKTIYLVERFKGVHVIDNTDPSNPDNIGFINAPGCIDIAIRKESLLLDNAVDLVAINISSLANLQVTERVRNVFPESTPPGQNEIPYSFLADQRPQNTIIVGWRKLN